MNFTDLEYFLAVVEEGGFIAASRRLFAIKKLSCIRIESSSASLIMAHITPFHIIYRLA